VIDVAATGLSLVELRALSAELSGRRPAKDLRQLSAFLDEMRPGDPVALPIEGGAGLLLGEIVGDYVFQGRELLPHRRPARWDRVVPRSAALAPATLQDPRALFSVVMDPTFLR
jgi:predicted Mrr-cat superfamily restriction endonuclease